MKLTWTEVSQWHTRYIKLSTEEIIIQELSFDKDGKPKELPSQNMIQEKVNARIKEEQEKFEQEMRILQEIE